MRVHRLEDVPGEAVPVLVDHDWQATSDDDALIVSRVDGVSSVEEIACEAGARLSSVRALIFQLTWLGAVELHERMEIDDDEIVEIVDPPPLVADALPLTRRRPPPTEAPLVSAVLAALGRLGQ